MSGMNASENVSRPRDGKINLREDFPFEAARKSKAENFSDLKRGFEESLERGTVMDNRTVGRFIDDMKGRSTTKEELMQGAEIAEEMVKHPEALSEEAQLQLMDLPQDIATHRNANYPILQKSRDIVL
jgi:hypothetical protein